MSYILIYLLVLFLTFVVMYFVTYYLPLKKNNLGTQAGYRYVVKKYDLSIDKKRVRLLSKIIAGVNAFLVSIPTYIVVMFNKLNIIVLLVISFVLFVVGIIGLYNLVGIILKKKGW